MSSYLIDFIYESNRIENITTPPNRAEINVYESFLHLDNIKLVDVENFINQIANVPIRSKNGMNVYVENHKPERGGPEIPKKLEYILACLNEQLFDPYEIHSQYETLHAFMDCNGRSGRIIWLWQRQKLGLDSPLGFLHHYYCESLEHSR